MITNDNRISRFHAWKHRFSWHFLLNQVFLQGFRVEHHFADTGAWGFHKQCQKDPQAEQRSRGLGLSMRVPYGKICCVHLPKDGTSVAIALLSAGSEMPSGVCTVKHTRSFKETLLLCRTVPCT